MFNNLNLTIEEAEMLSAAILLFRGYCSAIYAKGLITSVDMTKCILLQDKIDDYWKHLEDSNTSKN